MTYHHLGKYLGPDLKEIKVAMAVRDLMSAIFSLSQLPSDLVKQEYVDIELAHGQLHSLLDKIYDRDTVRELRLRSHGHAQATPGAVVVREVSEA